ncbi:MAG: 2-hydroxychromene-2-carboxylate isomerase [Zoogloeaceae bacterium]|nr:2-hydroxychromene-2-carboxylate isomerase [Zoogloeaceae bacterium]
MFDPIDFHFDFSSPYGYLMSERIDALAARFDRKVRWKPMLLGVVYKQLDSQPLPSIPMKGPYSLHDIRRSARHLGIALTIPAAFPVATQHAARAYYWLHGQDCAMARAFAHAVFRAYFVDGRDISNKDVVVALAAAVGADADACALALDDDAVKQRLKDACGEALAAGVFGSPYVVIDGEPFWGVDRLAQIERWLAEGGF